MIDKKRHYERNKIVKTRFLWLQSIQHPYNIKAIEAVRYVKKAEADTFLETNITMTSDRPIDVFLGSIFFVLSREGKDYWISKCKELEAETLKRQRKI